MDRATPGGNPRSWRGWASGAVVLLAAFGSIVAALPARAQTRGGTLSWSMPAEPETLAPYLSVSPGAAQLGAKMYDGLLDYDEDRRPEASLAERWETAPDGRAITFHLRPGVVFHDGKPFTSADVRFTILEVLRKYHPRGATVFRRVTAVETPDAQTAVVRLSEPAPYLLSALSAHESPMLPQHILAGVIASPGRAKAPLAVGTGPFKLAARVPGETLRLARNDKYWRKGAPLLDAIDVRFAGSEAARAALLESGEMHLFSGFDTDTAHRLKTIGSHRLRLDGADALAPVAALSLNTSRWPFDKLEVRQAVSLAIDRQAVISGVWHGFGRPAAGPIPVAFLRGPDAPSAPRKAAQGGDDIERANALLDAAGLPRKEDGIRFALVHDVAPLGPEWQRLTEGVELQLAKVGIKVASRFETIEAWLQRISVSGDFTLASSLAYGLSDPAIALHRTLHSASTESPTPFTNSARWRNVDADTLIDLAGAELDPARRLAANRALQELATAHAPMVWLAELTPPVFVHVNARRVMTAPFGLYGNFAETWIATGEAASHAVLAERSARSAQDLSPGR